MTIKSEHASPAGTGTTLGLVSGERERDELANEVNEELERLSVGGKEEEQGSARGKGERRAEATPVRERRVLRVLAAVSAQRLPHHVLQHMFTFLPASDVRACMRVCRHWASVLESGEGPVWRGLARRIVPEAALADPYLLAELPNHKHKLRAFKYAWNPNDASKNNYLRPNGFTIHRQPVAQSTDGVRGKLGVVSGCHAFELVWEGPLGTVAVIGIATKHAALHCPGYVALLGSDEQSWGWNLVDNTLMHNGESAGVYPRVNNPPKYQIGERIRLVIDCDSHAAYFERGGHFLGVAWEGLPPVRLFPAVCAVYGNTEVSMVYMGEAVMG